MKSLLAAITLCALVATTAWAAKSSAPPATIAPAPLQSLPPPGPPKQLPAPQLSPDLDKLFVPIERIIGPKPIVVTGASKPEEKPEAAPCASQPNVCVLAYRFSGPVDKDAAAKLSIFLDFATRAGAKMVMLEITTEGGLFPQGHEMARMIEMFPGNVVCVVDSTVASMGAYILQSCDRRLITKRSLLMVHQVLAALPEPYLNANQLRQRAASASAYTDMYFEQIAWKSKLTVKQVRAKVGGHDWYVKADEAVKFGLADAIVSMPPNKVLFDLMAGHRP